MDFWPEFLAKSWGREFIAGGFGGVAGVVAGHPLDTVRVKQQHSRGGSTFSILRKIVASDGPRGLYRGMGAPLASVTFQNAMVFQTYVILSKAFDKNIPATDPPSYKGVFLGGIGTGAIQSLILSPVELVKIRLQLMKTPRGPLDITKRIFRRESWKGIFRGLTITVLRDAPSHGVYFWTYEFIREQLHPGCRKDGQESFQTMWFAGGIAGVISWICCYPLDVVKTRIQGQSDSSGLKYNGIVDCFRRCIKEEGHSVLWRGLGAAITRAFIVNGAVFAAYETSLRFLPNNGNNHSTISSENAL